MNFQGIAALFGLSLIASSVTAQPVMVTDLDAGESWLESGYSKNKLTSDTSHHYPLYFAYEESSDSSNQQHINASLITVADTLNTFKPVIGFDFNRISFEDDKIKINNFSLGALFALEDSRQGYLAVTYAQSDKPELIRNAFKGQLSFKMNEKASTLQNQLSLNTAYKKKFESTKGGHQFGISNKTKFSLNSKFGLVINLGTTLITKEEFSDYTSTHYDYMYTYGGEININPTKDLTLRLGLANTESRGYYNQDSQFKFHTKDAQTFISLVSKF